MGGSAQAKKDLLARRARGMARALLIYGLLIGGSVVFALPFVWMVGTSFKVEREVFGEKITLFPMRPIPAQASPYLDSRYFHAPKGERYETVRPMIEAALRSRDLPLPSETHGTDDAVDILTPGVFKRLEDTLPHETWDKSREDLQVAVEEAITDEMVGEVIRKVFRSFSLGSVRVRSFEVQESEVTSGNPISDFWEVESQIDARLVEQEDAKTPQADLVYDFGDDGAGEIRLSRVIDLPFQADRLFRINIVMKPDDSWHAVDFYIEKGGKRYKTIRPEYMGRFLWRTIILQEYGPDDEPDASKIRTWVPYKLVDEKPGYVSDPQKVKVTMVLRPNSNAGAWSAKCRRNYRTALDFVPFWRYAATSVFLVVLNIIGNIFACSLVAYSFARLQWPGRNLSFGLMLATMMIPPQVTMIPYFLIIKHLGWYNTLKPLWVISFFGNAFNIFLLRQFMKGIPRDLEDAARIDGCNFMQVYWYVIMPLIRPTLACIAIFTFMYVWNDFMGPLIYVADQRLYPLSLGIFALQVQSDVSFGGGNFGMLMAASLLMTLPVVVIFFFAQKYFIQGVTLTGMKG